MAFTHFFNISFLRNINFNTVYEILDFLSEKKLPPLNATIEKAEFNKETLYHLFIIITFIYIVSAILGSLLHQLTLYIKPLSELIPGFRYINKWQYLNEAINKNSLTSIKKNKYFPTIALLVETPNGNIFYNGLLHKYELDQDGNIDFIILELFNSAIIVNDIKNKDSYIQTQQ